MSASKKSKDAEDILSEFQDSRKPEPEPQVESPEPQVESPEPEPQLESPEPEPQLESPEPEPQVESPESEPQLESPESEPQLEAPESEPQLEAPEPEPQLESPESETKTDLTGEEKTELTPEERNVIYVGTKPIMSYVAATLTQLSTMPIVTIKARGKRITQAVDVSQMIVKRMYAVGYEISDVRISSDSLTSQDGKKRNVSTIELDITKN
ncbi:MAG TPA: DNA-binding protein [Nitrosopumilaceae archaeon]|nr:DNA-binding protein [Nitrosopumilaceae archaeon]